MKKNLCLFLQIHLPAYLRDYRFFDMGNSQQYFDEFKIKTSIQELAETSYLPLNKILLDIIKVNEKKFKLSFSITGEVIDQMEKYAPEALDSFKQLAKTGCVEFVNETYSHSLIFLKDEKEFKAQVEDNAASIKKHFGQTPSILRLTGMVYSDKIGELAARMGYETMLTDDAKHIMGWKSPNQVFSGADGKLNLLVRNSRLSEPISFYFSDPNQSFYPVTCEKMVQALNSEKGDLVNIFMDYAAFGHRHNAATGIFEFMKYLPECVWDDGTFEFATTSEIVEKHKPTLALDIPYPISWYEAERDLSIWLGNDMQKDAFETMSNMGDQIRFVSDPDITSAWKRMQDSDHFYFMCTRWQEDKLGRRYRNPYSSPYDAYINYMNVLSDLSHRLDKAVDLQLKKLMENEQFAVKMCQRIDFTHTTYTASQVKKLIEIINTEKEIQEIVKSNKTKLTASKKSHTPIEK